jgi:hypothetical protein
MKKYTWSTKLKKFGITDPFLKIVVEKYENEIYWGKDVTDSISLNTYIQNVLFKKLIDKVNAKTSNYYIKSKNLNIDLDHIFEETTNETVKLCDILDKKGEYGVKKYFVNKVNNSKKRAFLKWINLITEEYPNCPAFWLLLLRSIFDSSINGTRREVIRPNADTIEWIYMRINIEQFMPNESILEQYCSKLAKKPVTGWQFIKSDKKNSNVLSAYAKGSGWCIAGSHWSSEYISYCDFYIFFYNKNPQVAIRVHAKSKAVLEIRGRYNDHPKQWINEINIFLRSIRIYDNSQEYTKVIFSEKEWQNSLSNYLLHDKNWWDNQFSNWYFSILYAPENIKSLYNITNDIIINYPWIINEKELIELFNIKLDNNIDFWIRSIEKNPYNYLNCPSNLKLEIRIENAHIIGWCNLIKEQQVTERVFNSISSSVKNSLIFNNFLNQNLPKSILTIIRKQPATFQQRKNRRNVDDFITTTENESAKVACERLVNIILNNEDGIFCDFKFGEKERNRIDFKDIRKKSWKIAIEIQPPLWFALPFYLKKKMTNLN